MNMLSFQLDVIKEEEDQNKIEKTITDNLSQSSPSSIVMFYSPESLIQPAWLSMFNSIVDHHMLQLLHIDKVHLFIEFDITFRKEFLKLKNKIIEKFKYPPDNQLIAPILFMNANFDMSLHMLLKKLPV